jgi:hypothetical protein
MPMFDRRGVVRRRQAPQTKSYPALRIVDHKKQRGLCGRLRDQTECCQPDEGQIRGLIFSDPKGRLQCAALWLGKSIQALEERKQELMESRKGKPRL